MTNLWTLTKFKPNTAVLMPGATVPEVFWNAVAKRGPNIWMRQKDLGLWQSWTWDKAAQAVNEIAGGLLSLGLKHGECASILSNTRVEWVLADLAILSCAGVSNGVYPTDASNQVHYLCQDSSTVILFVEDEEQLDKALEVRDKLPKLRKIVVLDMEGLRNLDDAGVMSMKALREAGREWNLLHPAMVQERVKSCKPEALAILVYTSGTTGRPKGAMQSHAGLVAGMHGASAGLPQSDTDERMCFLPLCHIAERVIGEYTSIYSGCVLNFVENPETIPENVREIAPTFLFAVPRVWEKFYSGVVIAIKEASTLQQVAYAWSIGVGKQVAECTLAGQPVSPALKFKFELARVLALNNVRKMIGIHRARALLSGAAPISPDLIRWYLALGIPMLEGWGQTESGALGTFTTPDRMKPGTIGLTSSGMEVRVDAVTGELLLRGPTVFMGYLNQPEKTAETIDKDGWLHTGDVGSVDAEGFFKITDRMKDIIITAGGKNVTPSELENELKFSPYITDAVVVGDKRAYLTVIIMIDQENVEKFAQDADIAFSNYTSLTKSVQVQELVQTEINRVNKKFARVEQIKKFWLLDTQLSAEDEELTPTMKLKRKLVEKKYSPQIEAMYG